MRLRILILSLVLIAIVACAVAVFFLLRTNTYSTDFKEAFYIVDTFEDNDIFTPQSTVRVTFIKPAPETEGFISYCDKDDDRIYFIFTDLSHDVVRVKFNNIANRQLLFDVYVRDYDYATKFFCTNTKDWEKGFNINGTKINFIAQSQ